MKGAEVPERIGKYRIDHVIGRGAIGIVYKGYDEQIDRPLAIKTLRPEFSNDVADGQNLLKRFATEARSAARCLHPNIVTVFDLVEHEQRPYIVMEYVNAGTLEDVIRSGALVPVRQVGEIMAQILLALDHAHSKGVLHRDIKPANILCPSATSIKVTDFGVARLDSLDLTGSNALGALGTPSYMAPERFLRRRADARSDLFSAGVILHQLLTGVKPFVALDLPELMQKLLNENPPSIIALRPDLWPEIDAVAHKALARNPEDRYQTAERFAEALNAAIEARPHDNLVPLDLTQLSRSDAKRDFAGLAGTELTMATRLSISAIDALSGTLARWLGPVAWRVVRQALQETSDVEALLASLSRRIKSEPEIALFRQNAEKLVREDLALASARAEEMISEGDISAAVDALLPMIGPLTRRLVTREARTAVGRDDFFLRLAGRIADERAKARFLALRERQARRATH
jgi:serine/threonine protein kinase